jgi:hypothetical protein
VLLNVVRPQGWMLREIDLRGANVVEVVGEDDERVVGHDLADLAPSVAGPAELFQVLIGHDAPVEDDLPGKDQRGLLFLVMR